MKRRESIELAAQCWCDPLTAKIQFDSRLAHVIARAIHNAYIRGLNEGAKLAPGSVKSIIEQLDI